MKKILVLASLALVLIGCTTTPEVVPESNTVITIGEVEGVKEEIKTGVFGGVKIDKLDEVKYTTDIEVDDSEFLSILARSIYVNILDYKFDFSEKYESPSKRFIELGDISKITTPNTNGRRILNYTLNKNKVSFDDALTLDQGICISDELLNSSMPLVKYSYLINDAIEADLVISKQLGYPGEAVSYTASFILTAVNSREYITTSVTSDGLFDINEAVYLSAFTNESYNTLKLMYDLIDESYLTDITYDEVLNYKARIEPKVLSNNSSIMTVFGSDKENGSINFNRSYITIQEISLSRKKFFKSIEDGLQETYTISDEVYTTDDDFEFIRLNQNIRSGKALDYAALNKIGIDIVSEDNPFKMYTSIAKIDSKEDVDIKLYYDWSNQNKYIIATADEFTYISKFEFNQKSKIFMYLFDLLGQELM